MAWINSDGLAVRIGRDESNEGNRGGVATISGPNHILELKINATELSLTSLTLFNESIINLPRGMRIEKLEILVETAFTSAGAATLFVGLRNLDRTTLNSVALVSGLPVASLTAGALITMTIGSPFVGSFVGTALSVPALVTIGANVAAFTAGRGMIRIYGYMP